MQCWAVKVVKILKVQECWQKLTTEKISVSYLFKNYYILYVDKHKTVLVYKKRQIVKLWLQNFHNKIRIILVEYKQGNIYT